MRSRSARWWRRWPRAIRWTASAGTANLPDPRSARLDVSHRLGADDEPGPAGGGGPARLPRDRGSLPHLSAGREPADPRLADGARYGLRITRVAALPAP